VCRGAQCFLAGHHSARYSQAGRYGTQYFHAGHFGAQLARPVGCPAGRRPRHPGSPCRGAYRPTGPASGGPPICRPGGRGSSLALTVTSKGRYPSLTSMCVRMPAVPAQRGWLRGVGRVGLPHPGLQPSTLRLPGAEPD
jgi:hypothetical protein